MAVIIAGIFIALCAFYYLRRKQENRRWDRRQRLEQKAERLKELLQERSGRGEEQQ